LPFTQDSVFWFNFFPALPALFEKTFTLDSEYLWYGMLLRKLP
jgi:hypothetical protein